MRFGVILGITLAVAAASAAPALSPQSVANSLAILGARVTLEQIYGDPAEWSSLQAGIATGEPVWLNLARQLRQVSDAGATEQIDLAAGEALEHRPAVVLSLVLDDFGIPEVCGGPDEDNPRFNSYDLSMRAISRRQEMLRAVNETRLLRKRNACIRKLENAKKDIARFYGRGA